MASDEEYFYSHTNISDGCWAWVGPKFNHGYGCAVRGKKLRILAHRMSWQIHNGEIPCGMVVMHSCDNPLCVNPSHLSIGTQGQNVRDMIIKRRDYRGPPQKGSKNGQAKLTEAEVMEIRSFQKSHGSGVKLAKLYNVSVATVSLIRSGDRWNG